MIEYGFKQVKTELGWHDYRLTDYSSIERWWEIVFSAYLLVSYMLMNFKQHQQSGDDDKTKLITQLLPFSQHVDWQLGTTWKSALNNLRLLIQPYWFWGWLFSIPGLKRGLHQLMDRMNTFRIMPTLAVQVA